MPVAWAAWITCDRVSRGSAHPGDQYGEITRGLAHPGGGIGLAIGDRPCGRAGRSYPSGVFNSLGWPEIAVLLVVALVVFGPERLPKAAAEAGRMLRTLRQLANTAREDLKSELGPELGDLDLASLNPRTFVRKNLLGDDLLGGDLFGDQPPAQRSGGAVDAADALAGTAVVARLLPGEPAPYDREAT